MLQLILFCDNRLSKSVSALPYKVYVLAYCIYTNLNICINTVIISCFWSVCENK